MFSPSRSLAMLALLYVGLTMPAAALPDDRAQPIQIKADQLIRDEKLGITVYSGQVQMNQGSLHIEADQITIFGTGENADKIVAQGQPATLQQQPDIDKGPVHASATTIEYYQSEDRVHLKGDATIDQDGSTVSGETIDYFVTEQLVKADSKQTGDQGRVIVVIPPRVSNPSEESSGATDSK